MSEADIFLAVHVGYNASAALMVNGEIVAAAQEERYTRRTNETGLPAQAIEIN